LPDTTLSLGPVVFTKFEIPQKINFGGRQNISIHSFSDGSRIIDAMGPDDADIEFSGILSGSEANQRALLIDSIRKSGNATYLTWDIYCYYVVIKEFSVTYENQFWLPYRIRCTILGGVPSQNIIYGMGVNFAISNSVQQAVSLGSIDGVDWVTLETALTKPDVFAAGTSAYLEATVAAEATNATIRQSIDRANREFETLNSIVASGIEGCVGMLSYAVNLTFKSWQLVTAGGSVGKICVTLASISVLHKTHESLDSGSGGGSNPLNLL